MKKLLLVILLFSTVNTIVAQTQRYSRIKIWTGENGMRKLSRLGIETDHGDYRRNVYFISDFSEKEISKIAGAGFRYDVLIDDVSEYYKKINSAPSVSKIQGVGVGVCDGAAPVYQVPSNFSLGSYAGYFTYQEMLDNLDSMASKYPNLITIRDSIPGGASLEGRPVYYLKISDNPVVDETEPEMLYTAVHHAREPGGMSQLIFYMWYLLENYSTDVEIQNIVDNTELFFIPCINPDGYIYNEINDPSGGGMWRKNRRDNLDGSYGVDLNRNYGYNWGYDDDGSSPDGWDETYRGTIPFSEPETQLIRDFLNSREIRIALNYHTFGNLLIYPWGYDYSTYTPDSALFTEYGMLLTTYNGYTFGTADQTVQYIVNGSSDDWMYGEQTSKPKVFAMTPETGDGAFGFWPPASEILPICQLNMFQNITAAQLTGKYATLEESSPTLVSTGGGGYINYSLKQLGLDTTGTYTITLTGITPNITSTASANVHGNLGLLQTVNDSIFFTLVSPISNGDEIKFLLSIDNGQYVKTDTITKYFGFPTVAFASDGNSTNGWTIGFWGISNTIFYSPTGSITDSPLGDYNSNSLKSVRMAAPADLTTAIKASLTFYARWAIEPNYDWVQVQASTDNGNTWTPLCGKYTVPGSISQPFEEPVYEGFQSAWVKEEMSLDDYLGTNVLIRVRLSSDGWQEYDGFYFDDVLIEKVLPGTMGMEEISESGITSLMPNPATSYTYVNINPGKSGKILVYDAIGKLVLQQSYSKDQSSVKLNISNLNQGVYYIISNVTGKPLKLVVQ